MIEAELQIGKGYCLQVQGHAGSAEAGKDLVCAAASILTETVAENVRILAEQGVLREVCCRLDKGNARVECVPYAGASVAVQIIYTAVSVGFRLLAEHFPHFVKFSQTVYCYPRAGGGTMDAG